MIAHSALEAAFAEFAHALLDRYDIGTVLYRLTDHAVEVLGVDGAGVSLADGAGLAFITASDDRVVRIEENQIEVAEGPCHDAHRTGRHVFCRDLASDERWPDYARVARAAGCRSVAGIPMPARQTTIGALNLYRSEPHDWTGRELQVAQILADMAAGHVVHARALDDARVLNRQLQHALDSRVIIEQAKGMIAARNGLDPAEAFTSLRAHARQRGRRLHDVAAEVVAGDLEL